MRIRRALAVTDVGKRMSENQDAVLEAPDVPLYAIADGTGGLEGAQRALQVLQRHTGVLKERVKAVASNASSTSRLSIGRFFESVFDEANQAVHELSERLKKPALGTTLICATVVGRSAFIGHVGNCRAYLLRQGQLWRVTNDHTVAMRQYRKGAISIEEFQRSPFQKTLTQALGVSPRVDPEFAEVWLSPGDTMMICSDGLSRMVPEERILEGMQMRDPGDGSRYLLSCAHNVGAPDNVSFVLMQLASEKDPTSPEDVAETLREVFLFGKLSEPDRMVLAPYLDELYFEAGEPIMEEGHSSEGFYVVISGKVQLSRQGTILGEVGPGGHLGELALTRQGRNHATATTIEKTRVFALDRDRFHQLLRAKPHIGIRLTLPLLERLGTQVADLTERLITIDRAVQRNLTR